MAVDTISPLLQLTLQATGNNNNTWGDKINNLALTPLENAIAGPTMLTNASGTVNLTTPQRMNAIIDIRASLTGDVTIVDAVATSKWWMFYNGCTLNGHAVKMQAGGGTAVTVPAGLHFVYTDGANGVLVL